MQAELRALVQQRGSSCAAARQLWSYRKQIFPLRLICCDDACERFDTTRQLQLQVAPWRRHEGEVLFAGSLTCLQSMRRNCHLWRCGADPCRRCWTKTRMVIYLSGRWNLTGFSLPAPASCRQARNWLRSRWPGLDFGFNFVGGGCDYAKLIGSRPSSQYVGKCALSTCVGNFTSSFPGWRAESGVSGFFWQLWLHR